MRHFWFHSLLLSFLAFLVFAVGTANGGVLFSSLPRTLQIDARIQSLNATTGVAKAGVDELRILWGLDTTLDPSVDDNYVDVKLGFCYAPESQKDRPWRKNHDDLHKDKTCQVEISAYSWYAADGLPLVWSLGKDVPGGSYFVRIYALDADGKELAYGQTTDRNKSTNLITSPDAGGSYFPTDCPSIWYAGFF
ncbi:hypothetical protein R1flu_016476 [Riccia fluitans]|uniref:High-affinity nitrate transporter n=1 Tax=Riccia fluitans TaxID=41844 RepID=A0ABD1YM57_9MARC